MSAAVDPRNIQKLAKSSEKQKIDASFCAYKEQKLDEL